MTYRFLFMLIFIHGALPVCANNDRHFTLKNTHLVQLKSAQTDKLHELVIALPASYYQHPAKKYPVLYFMDGYWDMPLLSAIYSGLIYDGVAPEFIMVGLSYAGDNVNYDAERLRDLTPTKVIERSKESGGAPAFLDFIKQSLVPMIEKEVSH